MLRTGGNLGYGTAVNRAVAKLASEDEYLIVANPDVVWAPGSIDELLAAAERWPRAATLGPLIRDPDGSIYPSARHLPSLIRGGMHAVVGFAWKGNPWTKTYRQERLEPSERPVGWLSGSCLLVRREAFDQIGGFDERYFMYMEDVDLGDRFGRAGWLNVYVPSAEILHDKGHSTGRDPARNLRAHHDSTYIYLTSRHIGWWRAPLRWTMRGALKVRARAAVRKSRRELARVGPDERNRSLEVDAVVLVGGKGTRLRPLTLSAPKPMLPTAGLPFLTHLLSRIAAAGVEHVILSTSYQAATFEAEFGDGSKLGLQIEYVTETDPLGTGGGIANVAPRLRNDTVMVFNGDVLSGADLTQMLAAHHDTGAELTLHLVRVSDPRAFGCVPTDDTGRVLAFLEDRGPAHRPDQRRHLHLQPVDHRPDPARPRGVGGTRGFPCPAQRRRQGLRLRRLQLLARHGHPEDFVRGSSDLVRGLAPSPALGGSAARAWCTTGRRWPRVRC